MRIGNVEVVVAELHLDSEVPMRLGCGNAVNAPVVDRRFVEHDPHIGSRYAERAEFSDKILVEATFGPFRAALEHRDLDDRVLLRMVLGSDHILCRIFDKPYRRIVFGNLQCADECAAHTFENSTLVIDAASSKEFDRRERHGRRLAPDHVRESQLPLEKFGATAVR